MKITHCLITLCAILALSSCKLRIVVPEGGSVVAQSGAYSCASGKTCGIDIVDFYFDQTFVATPADGYKFKYWKKADRRFCGNKPSPCHVTTVGTNANKDLAGLMMSFFESDTEVFYLQPVFEKESNNIKIDADTFDGGGIITKDTVWSSEKGPFRILNDVQIAHGITLTVLEGVVVEGSDRNIKVFGELQILGASRNPVKLHKVNIVNGGTSVQEAAHVDINFALLQESSIFPATGNGGYGSLNLRNSQITNSSTYSYLWYPTEDVHIERNIFRGYNQLSIGHSEASVYIRNNVFTGYNGVVIQNWAAYSGVTLVENNSFLAVGIPTLMLPGGYDSSAMSAASNYWGTTNQNVIQDMIIDKSDDLSAAGYIEFRPIRSAPHPSTPGL